MESEEEAAQLAAQTTVFLAAAAVLSGGRPVDPHTVGQLRAAMAAEGTPKELIESVSAQCARGLQPEAVPVLPVLSPEQVALYASSLTAFALRAAPQGDPVELCVRLCAPYQVPAQLIEALAKELSSALDLRRSTDVAASLRLLLEPPEQLVRAARKHLGGRAAERAPRRSVGLVSPSRIQHPSDREGTDSLREASGLDELVSLLMKYGVEKQERVSNVGSRVRVGPTQFPGLYAIFQGCVQRAGVKPEPELYLENGAINASTFGSDRPYVVLHSGAVTLLSTPELEFIIGHELGHIRFGHVLNLMVGYYLQRLALELPFGKLIARGLQIALAEWERNAELSADRMGLLVCQDPDAALRVMVKWSGVPAALYHAMNVEAFLAQHEDFQALDREIAGVYAKVVKTIFRSHPWTVVRAHELRRWVQAGDYERLLAEGSAPAAAVAARPLAASQLRPFECPVCGVSAPPDAGACASCRSPLTERNRFNSCARCGASVRPSLVFCESCGARQQSAAGGVP